MSKLRKYTTIFYSTHILDDVQRVSDTVVILDKGQLVARGPIEELLAGSEGVVYIVHLRGEVEAVRQQVLAQSWVGGIIDGQHNGESAWQVSVSDSQAAETPTRGSVTPPLPQQAPNLLQSDASKIGVPGYQDPPDEPAEPSHVKPTL